jgi:hypothetical protein
LERHNQYIGGRNSMITNGQHITSNENKKSTYKIFSENQQNEERGQRGEQNRGEKMITV